MATFPSIMSSPDKQSRQKKFIDNQIIEQEFENGTRLYINNVGNALIRENLFFRSISKGRKDAIRDYFQNNRQEWGVYDHPDEGKIWARFTTPPHTQPVRTSGLWNVWVIIEYPEHGRNVDLPEG